MSSDRASEAPKGGAFQSKLEALGKLLGWIPGVGLTAWGGWKSLVTYPHAGMTFAHRTSFKQEPQPAGKAPAKEQTCGPHAILQFEIVNPGPGELDGITLKVMVYDTLEGGKVEGGKTEGGTFTSGLKFEPIGVARAVAFADSSGAGIRVTPGDNGVVPLDANSTMGIILISPSEDWTPKSVVHVTGSTKTQIPFEEAAVIKMPPNYSVMVLILGIGLLIIPFVTLLISRYFRRKADEEIAATQVAANQRIATAEAEAKTKVEAAAAELALKYSRAPVDAGVPTRTQANLRLDLLDKDFEDGDEKESKPEAQGPPEQDSPAPPQPQRLIESKPLPNSDSKDGGSKSGGGKGNGGKAGSGRSSGKNNSGKN